MKELKLKFEVGDWVRDIQDGALYKIKEIKEFPEEPPYKRFIFSSTEETWIDIYNDEVDTDGWELWQPITGEFCWFWNESKTHPTLATFTNKSLGLYYSDISNDGFDFCEPFIGQLPTILGL